MPTIIDVLNYVNVLVMNMSHFKSRNLYIFLKEFL